MLELLVVLGSLHTYLFMAEATCAESTSGQRGLDDERADFLITDRARLFVRFGVCIGLRP